MEFISLKESINLKINEVFKEILEETKKIENFSEVENIVALECVKNNNLLATIETEIISLFELEIIDKLDLEKAQKVLDSRSLQIKKMEKIIVLENELITEKKEKRKKKKEKDNIDADKIIKNSLLGAGLGSGVGALCSKKKIPGGIAGAIVGGCAVGLLSIGKHAISEIENIDEYEEIVITKKVFDNNKLIVVLENRKREVKSNILSFIAEVERASKNLFEC